MSYLLYLMFRCDGDVMESLDFGGFLVHLGLVWQRARILALEENLSRMKGWMKSICKTFLGMIVTFRDESNDSN